MIAGVWCRWHTARNRAPEKQRDHRSGVGFRYFERVYKNNNIQIHGCARCVFARAVIILYTLRFYYIHALVCVWQFFFLSCFVVRIYTVQSCALINNPLGDNGICTVQLFLQRASPPSTLSDTTLLLLIIIIIIIPPSYVLLFLHINIYDI